MKKAAKKRRETGLVVKWKGLKKLRKMKGYTQERLSDESKISTDQIQRIEQGKAGVSQTQIEIYAGYVGLSLEELVTGKRRPEEKARDDNSVGTWLIRSTGQWSPPTASGLQWRTHELHHKHRPGRKARGKLYDLKRHLAQATIADIRHWLTRHADVSDRIKWLSNHVGRNIDCVYDERQPNEWWVIDEWIDGVSLHETLDRAPLERAPALHFMLQVAEALNVLHEAGLVYRVLSPRAIFLTATDAIITDFELTKISESGQTVWPVQQYPRLEVFVAPEIRSREQHPPSADLFSWAMILANTVAGRVPEGEDSAKRTILDSGLPNDVIAFAIKCLGGRSKRPTSFAELLDDRRQIPSGGGK